MDTFKKRMLPVAVIAVLAVVGSLMNSQQSTIHAAGGPMCLNVQTKARFQARRLVPGTLVFFQEGGG
jgi:hypothetical protein